MKCIDSSVQQRHALGSLVHAQCGVRDFLGTRHHQLVSVIDLQNEGGSNQSFHWLLATWNRIKGKMTRTLYLLRHAKSSWRDASQTDMERPLNARGRAAAKRMGAHIATLGALPELVICSPAARTEETLEIVQSCFAAPLPSRSERRIYGGRVKDLLSILQSIPGDVHTAMLVGHNPYLSMLAIHLAEKSAHAPNKLKMGMPTAALVHLELDCARWEDVGQGCGKIVRFVTPKELQKKDMQAAG